MRKSINEDYKQSPGPEPSHTFVSVLLKMIAVVIVIKKNSVCNNLTPDEVR